MIGRESEEQAVFKVTDRRKFNVDGTVREGVELESEKPKAETRNETQPVEATRDVPEMPEAAESSPEIPVLETEQAFDEEAIEDMPGADDPASFVNFLTTLASQAAAALGAVPHPVTGQRQVDLESGKYWIDILAMLREKTKNNLHAQESRLLDGLLSDLRMQYVAISKMAEERLKQQAAQKFSANDILGKK